MKNCSYFLNATTYTHSRCEKDYKCCIYVGDYSVCPKVNKNVPRGTNITFKLGGLEKILETFEQIYGFSAEDREIIIPNHMVRYKRVSSALKRNNPIMIWEVLLPFNNTEGTKISLREEGETKEGLITRLELNADLNSVIDLKLSRTTWKRSK